MRIVNNYEKYLVYLNADDEEPKCIRCSNCLGFDCEEYCGAEHGWGGYERIVDRETFWREVDE